MPTRFFDESSEHSRIKAAIVSKYFYAWANVIAAGANVSRIAYVDLFAGPGRYKDDTRSTPLLILEKAISSSRLKEKLVTLFNDANPEYTSSLNEAIHQLPGIAELKHPPMVRNDVVGAEMMAKFKEMSLIPALFFVDPWGYKGLSLDLVNAVTKDWACECIFFFNYNRINMGLDNAHVREHMDALFGAERAEILRRRLESLTPDDRELMIVEELCHALTPPDPFRKRLTLPFRFRNEAGSRTTHHLIFVTKHFLGYDIMKGVMAGESTGPEGGVPTFEYSPADRRYPTLFGFSQPLEELGSMLCRDFSGQTLTMEDIYRRHSVGKRYIGRNYKDVLSSLEAEGKIVADPPAKSRRMRAGKRTFANRVRVSFQ